MNARATVTTAGILLLVAGIISLLWYLPGNSVREELWVFSAILLVAAIIVVAVGWPSLSARSRWVRPVLGVWALATLVWLVTRWTYDELSSPGLWLLETVSWSAQIGATLAAIVVTIMFGRCVRELPVWARWAPLGTVILEIAGYFGLRIALIAARPGPSGYDSVYAVAGMIELVLNVSFVALGIMLIVGAQRLPLIPTTPDAEVQPLPTS